jgi:tyrosinase
MNINEKEAFVNVVLGLKRQPSQLFPPSQNRYDDYVLIHSLAMIHTGTHHYAPMQAHQGPAFLPWHREFIRRFELDLQAIDSRVTLPYWDWTKDNSEQSSIWTAEFLGGNGRESDGRVMDGPFAYDQGNWNLNILDSDDPSHRPYLRRRFGTFPNVPTLPTFQQVDDCLKVIPYDTPPWITNTGTGQPQPSFRNRLEGWYGEGRIHNRVHL